MNGTIIQLNKNSFKDTNGKEVSYCKFLVLIPCEENEDKIGYEIKSLTTKYENFNKLKSFINKTVNIETTFVENKDGLYKMKPVKINDFTL